MTTEQLDLLVQVEITMMDIDHQLRSWAEEIEVSYYGFYLDIAIDANMETLDIMLHRGGKKPEYLEFLPGPGKGMLMIQMDLVYPLAYYNSEGRHVVGTALIKADGVTEINPYPRYESWLEGLDPKLWVVEPNKNGAITEFRYKKIPALTGNAARRALELPDPEWQGKEGGRVKWRNS